MEREFEAQDRAACVATPTLELGIDIGDINLVVLYGVPGTWQSYLQRLGRANRRSTRIDALAAVPDLGRGEHAEVQNSLGFQALQNQLDTEEHDMARPFELYGAATQQLVSTIHAAGTWVGINRLKEVLSPWPHLDGGVVEMLLGELVSAEVLKEHPHYNRYGPDEKLYEFERLLQIWSNFPLGSQEIELRHGSTPLGTIPADNILNLRPGRVFTFSAARWEVMRVAVDHVLVRPASRGTDIQLRFGSTGAPVDPALVEQIRRLTFGGLVGLNVKPSASCTDLEATFKPLREIADPRFLPWANREEENVYLTFAGILANGILAAWSGADAQTATDFCFSSGDEVSFEGLPHDPRELVHLLDPASTPDEQLSIYQQRLPAELRRREIQNEWVARPIHAKILERLANVSPLEVPGHVFNVFCPAAE